MEDAREFLSGQNIDVDAIAPQVDGKVMSAYVRAVKPLGNEPCCGQPAGNNMQGHYTYCSYPPGIRGAGS